jgi:glycosyltransferase involved in cell wall biosynthesis
VSVPRKGAHGPVPGAPGGIERRRVPRDEQGTGEDLLAPFDDADPDATLLADHSSVHTAPRVVMFRPAAVEVDTRAKKIALSLSRAGYEVVLVSGGPPLVERAERWLGPVRVITVPIPTTARDLRNMRLTVRRRRSLTVFDWATKDEYVTRAAELRGAINVTRDGRVGTPGSPSAHAGHVWARAQFIGRRLRWRAQAKIDRTIRGAWRRWDFQRVRRTWLATDAGSLPEILDYTTAFSPVLDELEPDIIHAHHPTVLPTAVRAARRARGWGRECHVVYDARENFAGIPEREQGTVRRHHVLLRCEARGIGGADAVITVSAPIAAALQQRYQLPHLPAVLLNAPPRTVTDPGAPVGDAAARPSLRRAVGLPQSATLLVYSGGVSHARGIEVLIDALPMVPQAHLALVTVPFPHPSTPALLARAERLGVADRLHVTAPVGQDDLIDFLASADVALHPLPGGTPNHDQALPNKLFEYLHAGLPLVVSDAVLMADFVRTNDLGEVFTTGDAADLARAVNRVLDDGRTPVSRDELTARYCWQQQEPTLVALYRSLMPVPPTRDPGPAPLRFPDLDVTTTPPDTTPPGTTPPGTESAPGEDEVDSPGAVRDESMA